MFNANGPFYKAWIRIAVIDRPWKREEYEDQAEYSPLYCAAFYGLNQVAITLLRQGASPTNGAGLYSNSLQAASVRGHLQIVEVLLNAGADVNEEGGFFGTSLAAASACGHLEIVRKLLEAGASVDVPAPWARATSGRRGDPLYRAVEFGYLPICELLLENGTNDYVHSKSQLPTALQLAVIQGRLDIVKALLRYERVRSVNINRLKAGIQYHLGAQHRDAIWQELLAHNIIECNADEPAGPGTMSLLKKNADVNNRDEESEYLRALELAVEQGEIPTVEKLLGQKMDCDHEYAVSAALNAAIKADSTVVVQLLLDTGVDLNTHDLPHPKRGKFLGSSRSMAQEDETILTKEIRNRKENIACLLLNRGAQATPQTPETIGTPLLYAIWEGLTGLVNELLEQGADPNQRGTIVRRNKPTFPLLLATERSNIEIIDRLLQAGARVNDQDREGFSALHVAATSGGKIDALEFLLEIPTIDKNVTLLNGSLPIHSAASRGTAESIGVLLAAGFDIHAKNNTGRTPLHWAAVAGNWDTLEVLLEKGADASIRSVGHGADTPLDMAYLARRAPDWRKARDLEAHWDDERVDKLLRRLADRAAGK